jgi:hypothetical protein
MIACPVVALRAWLEAAAITEGPVFRPIAKGGRIQPTRLTDRSVAAIMKAHAQRAGLDPKQFAGHSLLRLPDQRCRARQPLLGSMLAKGKCCDLGHGDSSGAVRT